MKHLSIISSLVYVAFLSIYFLFGKSDSAVWSCYYYVNTSGYIALLLLDKLLVEKQKVVASLLFTAFMFQILFVAFEILLLFSVSDYFKLINSVFWSIIWFILAFIFIVVYKIFDLLWENG